MSGSTIILGLLAAPSPPPSPPLDSLITRALLWQGAQLEALLRACVQVHGMMLRIERAHAGGDGTVWAGSDLIATYALVAKGTALHFAVDASYAVWVRFELERLRCPTRLL